MIRKNIDKMIELSNSKKTCLGEILELTKKQKTLIENDNMEKIEELISSKDKLMKAIDILDIEFLSLYDEIKKTEDVDSLDELNLEKYKNIRQLQEAIGRINKLLKDISIIDKENTRIMKESLEGVKSSLRQVKEVKKAYKGYNYSSGGSILLDEKK